MRNILIKISGFLLVLSLGLYVVKHANDKHVTLTKARNTIQQVSKEHGIPSWIPLSIAFHESKFVLNKVGDKGSAFGLFQLHQDGLESKDLTREDLINEEINTKIAISNMESVYKRGLQQNLKGFELLKYVANNSGWPDNKGVQWTDQHTNYNRGLEKTFQKFSKQIFDYNE